MLQVPTSFADLPAALTAQVLSHVPQAPRLTQCALVCRAWASAATLSTVDVQLNLEANTVHAFNCWLQQHAGQLRTLRLGGGFSNPLRLPLGQFKQLQRLEVKFVVKFVVVRGEQLGASSSGQQLDVSNADNGAAAVSLPSLQHLQLEFLVLESINSLLRLTAAPQLTSLVFMHNNFAGLQRIESHSGRREYTEEAVQQLAAAAPAMLQRLPRLVVLELPGTPLSDEALQQLASMQGLRQVTLSREQHAAACDLQLLPSSITRLCYKTSAYGEEDPSLPPELQQLTGLLNLQLHYCCLPPTLLGSVTQLQTLHLDTCTLLPIGPEAEDESEGTAALLDALIKLTHLQDLELQDTGIRTTSVSPQRFAALTASSHLTRLAVQSHKGGRLPKGAVRHMFPSQRQQRLLRHLELRILYWHGFIDSAWRIDSTDLASIASCCPGLQHLDVTGTVQPGADVSVLLQLPDSCTSLAVGGAAFSDAAAATVVQLTQLKHLSWQHSKQLTDTGLQQLTALDLDSLAAGFNGLSLELHKALYKSGADSEVSSSQRLARDPRKVGQ
jgi:hypothetical protein